MKRKTSGPTAIKAIAVMGVVTFALLLLSLNGVEKLFTSAQPGLSNPLRPQSPFNGRRAFEELRTVVDFGPRPSGSEALARLQDHIESVLNEAGLEVRRHEFEAATPIGVLPMVNITGVIEGTEPGVIILGNHYETKYFPDIVFVGANDAGSTTAWMLEMARTLGPARDGKTLWLCFFDGEEAFEEWSATDSLYGSREYVRKLEQDGRIEQIAAMINLDMIGDCFLDIKRDRDAPEWLTRIIWNKARDLGYGQHFVPFTHAIEDDHIPFRRAGVPAINLIDFTFGKTPADHVKNWHTAEDTIDKVCAESLQVVGDVMYHALPEIDARTRVAPRPGQSQTRNRNP